MISLKSIDLRLDMLASRIDKLEKENNKISVFVIVNNDYSNGSFKIEYKGHNENIDFEGIEEYKKLYNQYKDYIIRILVQPPYKD